MKKSVLLALLLSSSFALATDRPPRGEGRLNLPAECYNKHAPIGHLLACRHVVVSQLAQAQEPMFSRYNPRPAAPNEFWTFQLAQEGMTYHIVQAGKLAVFSGSPAYFLRNALKKLANRIDLRLVNLSCAEKSRAYKDAVQVDQNVPLSLTAPLLRVPCH